jgi:hypothetical protein
MVKLPKPDHVPIIGRREETFACLYVVAVVGCTPERVRIGACDKPDQQLEKLKKENIAAIELRSVHWAADLRIAQRVLAEARYFLRDHRDHGDVFKVKAVIADRVLRESAKKLNIPLMTEAEYKRICRGPRERRENAIDNHLRAVGMTR